MSVNLLTKLPPFKQLKIRLCTRLVVLFFGLILLIQIGYCQTTWRYLGQSPPGIAPQLFAPNILRENNRVEFGSTFSKDGTEFFYSIQSNGFADILYMKYDGIKWSEPKVIFEAENYGLNDPMLNPAEDKLYFISQMPNQDNDTLPDHDIYYANRTTSGWSVPINAGPMINSAMHSEYYISFTEKGHMYFSSDREARYRRDFNIYRSEFRNGEFQTPVKLPSDINTGHYEADVYIAPDESYIIFASSRKGGEGQVDLYVSEKNINGNWGAARNLGTSINTAGPEYCPFVSHDGKYLFYTSNQDIYWVNMKAVLNR